MLKFKCYSDSGHGWCAVKRKFLESLGILDKVTPFSYQRGGTVYLEEDGDLSLFCDTLKEKGIEFELVSQYGKNGRWPDRSPIRSYESFTNVRKCDGYTTDLAEDCLITIDNGDMFEGYPHHFADNFFTNVYRNVIEDWCNKQNMVVKFSK